MLGYLTRLRTLLEHGIGLWDVVAEANRAGSLDSNIREHAENDLLNLAESLPKLHTIAFNGGTAARIGRRQLGEQGTRWRLLDLPSSSPAFTLPYAAKLKAWRHLLQEN